MLEKIKYINHLNEVIEFGEGEIFANYNDLRDYAWDYDANNDKITNFRRGIANKTLPLLIFGKTKESAINLKNRIFEIFEKDVLNNQKGAFWVGDYYYKCFVVEGRSEEYLSDSKLLRKEVTIVTDTPIWVKETNFFFPIQEVISSDNKRYAGRYAYRYANGLTDKNISNPHFAPSNLKLLIYGPATNPSVIIGANTYAVNTILIDGEYLVIDTSNKTIVKVQNNGTKVNLFNSRVKQHNVFAKVNPDVQEVRWDGSFAFDVTIFEERSEPKWTL